MESLWSVRPTKQEHKVAAETPGPGQYVPRQAASEIQSWCILRGVIQYIK